MSATLYLFYEQGFQPWQMYNPHGRGILIVAKGPSPRQIRMAIFFFENDIDGYVLLGTWPFDIRKN